MTNDATRENTNLKREFNKFINRFFFSKERSVQHLAKLYFLIDDLMAFLEKEQTKIGQELIDNDLEVVYIPEHDIKIFFDDSCGILLDSISKEERFTILTDSNNALRKKEEKANGL